MKLHRSLAITLFIVGIVSASFVPQRNVDKGMLGKWYWINTAGSSTFMLSLESSGDSLYGYYCSIVDKGNRIDCALGEYNISGTGSARVAKVKFNSFFDAKNGTAILRLIGDTSLIWEITKVPTDGDCYAPKKVTLSRHKRW
ncbi:MAG: hypothetical protein JNM41_07300 [Flavipsychrobacter sp.]|nr:hypothetical protein [Flavipsychrobacter sp.]